VRLHVYFARRFFLTFLAVLTGFALLLFLLDLVEQLRQFESAALGFGDAVGLTFLHVPQSIYRILPLVMILATLALFLTLARTSELVVVRASGRSALRSVAAPLTVALLVGMIAVSVFNPIVAATTERYELAVSRHTDIAASALSVSPEGLWLRQGDAAGQTVIRAGRANFDGTQLFDVSFVGFRRDGAPAYRIEAETARLEQGNWVMTNAIHWPLDQPNPDLAASRHDRFTLHTTLTRNQILDSFGTPSAVPVWELPAFIGRLEDAGFSARRHKVWLQMELAMPLLLVAMVLVGASFTMRQTRQGRTGLMVLLALVMGFGLYFIRNLAQVLGENGQIPIALSAWGPPVAAVLLPLGLLLHWEDG